MQHFRLSFLVTLFCLAIAFWWGGAVAVYIALILAVLEVSLSFDNAVVNAAVLKKMSVRWQHYFLTWGILIAVFGMRLILPVLIVSVATGIDFVAVAKMALEDPATYSHHLESVHVEIAAFGGMFLLMVFFAFILDDSKELHWLGHVEERLSTLGRLKAIEVILALSLLLIMRQWLPDVIRERALVAGISGLILYVIVDSFSELFEDEQDDTDVADIMKKSGLMSFIYLEILDASFSFDGVIGAFAITQDVIIIMLGLAIGAMFVRSLTVYLVNKGTLDQYVYLEHGAHYAIGVLAGIMLLSIRYHISEVVTGSIGAVLIILSVISSIRYNKKEFIDSGRED
ncbi:MAG: DUF475 domain-containing protein [Gammaproteobacteria bacterium]|nr:DUF475 domain-containing protein [Gammaproteobacteria bacterium]